LARIILGFVLAPLGLVFLSGWATPIELAVTYGICIVCGVPLFLLFRWLRWLHWWQVTIGGVLCAIPIVILYFQVNPYHIEIYGPANTIALLADGAAIALVFWWVAIFRNEDFTGISSAIPWSMLALPPVIACGVFVHHAFVPELVLGHVAGITGFARVSPTSQVVVQLDTGPTVLARIPDDWSSRLSEGKEVYLDKRRTLALTSDTYWVITCKQSLDCRD
jgi:hypothetical protein